MPPMAGRRLLRQIVILACAGFLTCTASLAAIPAVVGDILLTGNVDRRGEQLNNDSTLFEGDTLRTDSSGGAVLRLRGGRVEMSPDCELQITHANPLRLAVKKGTISFSFPSDVPFEIETPQLAVHPNLSPAAPSGIVMATPQTEDRVVSRTGNFTAVELQKNGAANHILPGQ